MASRGEEDISLVQGEGFPLASISLQGLEVVAFGPQAEPLYDLASFGVYAYGREGWYQAVFAPSLWIQYSFQEKGWNCRLFGQEKGFFALYLRVEEIFVGSSLFGKGALTPYRGEVQPLSWKGGTLWQEGSSRMQVHPLSGMEEFFGANFLVGYEMGLGNSFYTWQAKGVAK